MPRRRLAPLVLLLAAGAFQAGSAGAEPPAGGGTTTQERVESALARLRSPLQRDRLDGARDLTALLPDARPAVMRAWASGDEALRASLTDVLAADGSPELLGLALEAWRTGGDALAARARAALLKDTAASRRALEALLAAPGASAAGERRPLSAIAGMLDRDEVERLFLARKSRSGGTGFYTGQYAVLRPWRKLAIEVCLHIVTDRALRLPGTSAVGGYRFLRTPNQVLDVWEVRGMALNAVLDLATPADTDVLEQLEAYRVELEARPGDNESGDIERQALLDDLLATLYRLDPPSYRALLTERIDDLESAPPWNRRVRRQAAPLALRAGLYERAVRLYSRQLNGSDALANDHYNLACAYASWSLEPGDVDPQRLRRAALAHLQRAVAERWTDISWMEQDRDLDPIRDTPEYRALKARIEKAIDLPSAPPAPAPTPHPAPAPEPAPAPAPAPSPGSGGR